MISISEICDEVVKYHPSPNISLIKRAFLYASYYHKNQMRLSGEPYITHPLSVAKILTELRADDKTISSGLLHDVVEDTGQSIERISKFFGDEVAFLVDGVTKISNLNVNLDADEKQIENLRKMFVFMARDVRVILIKLADRLDNIRTLSYLPTDKQKRIANETIKIFAPIAHRLGLYNIKTELEDLSFSILQPDTAKYIREKLQEIVPKSQKFIDEFKEKIQEILKKEGIRRFKIESRIKGIYSLWEKIVNQGIDIENIYDIIGFRIIVEDVGDCYRCLGIIHSHFKPIPGKFKDYIAIPKPNGYKSLHTKVIIPGGYRVEFQIRTHKMHEEAEHGIASHWIYKEGSPISDAGLRIFSWLRSVLETSKESQYYEVKNISEDIYPHEIYVFTPKGDVKILPRGATVLDFAYSIHTELGARCAGAKVNGKLQPIDYILKSGDIVEVITSKNQKPKRSWLNLVVTQRAKSRIRQFVVKEEKVIAKEIGEETIKKELKKYNLDLQELIKSGVLSKVASQMKIKSLEELYISIGMGKISIVSFIKNIRKLIEPKEEKTDTQQKQQIQTTEELIGDLKGVKTRFALCCSPVYGDEAVGYITKGYGIVIHRKDCPQLHNLSQERTIRINQTNFPVESTYFGRIKLFVDYPEMISEIISKLNKKGYRVKEITSREHNSKFEIDITVLVRNKKDIESIINELSSLENTFDVRRA